MFGATDFVFTDGRIGQAIIDGIAGSTKRVVIISPYIKLWNNLERELESARKRNVETCLYSRSGKDSEMDLKTIARLFSKVGSIHTLHAKLYRFDDEILLSSMNLYDFSQSSSREIAIRILDKYQKMDIEEYMNKLIVEAESGSSAGVALGAPEPSVKKQDTRSTAPSERNRGYANPGCCIRCGIAMKFYPDKPLCPDCYKQWSKFKNPDYQENLCHSCGKEHKTTLLKPLCRSCWKADSAGRDRY
ncbi:MAG TPA: hypothetical protein VEI97_07365 [bacterium]|nr:hypothetical protein [bacterium]